jgi:transposase-like protein
VIFSSPRPEAVQLTPRHLHKISDRPVRARGHFPTEQAALKCLYLVTRSLDPTRRGKARWAIRWKPALNAIAITFEGRIVASHIN